MEVGLRMAVFLCSTAIFSVIGYLIKHRQLKEAYATGWVIVGLTLIWLAAWPEPFFMASEFVGVAEGTNALFLCGILFCVVYLLHLSAKVTWLERRIEHLVRENALMSVEDGGSDSCGDSVLR